MDLGSVFIISALLLLTIFFVFRPFSEPASQKPANGDDILRLIEERERILTDLRELDFDFNMGKIPAEDYPSIRERLMHQGADILRKIDQFPDQYHALPQVDESLSELTPGEDTPDPLFDTIETKIAERRRARQEKAAGFCPRCGSPIFKSDAYCWKCGHKID
jgi:hypothetical protein